MATPHAAPAPEVAPASGRLAALRILLKAAAFVAVVVVLEVAAAALLIPGSEQTRAIGEKLAAEAQAAPTDGVAGAPKDREVDPQDLREVNLGAFNILRYDPQTDASLSIDFELYGTVLAESEAEFQQLYPPNQRRIEEQIHIILRSVEVGDLADPGLGLIKRRILEKTNAALGKSLVREAIFSKFTFYER
jgi:flagellar FliL protein